MKNLKLSALSVLLLFLAGCYVSQPVASVPPPPQQSYEAPAPPPQAYQAPAPPATYQSFYDELAPYGSWVSDPRYGYVWLPNVEPGFRPYCTDGYWAYSDQGWTWISNYSWGWAPFHYGTWTDDPYYGWMWVPGQDWAPAWVTWGNYNGYYGWAPLAPGYQAGASYNPPMSAWCFTEPRYMGNRDWGNHYYVSNNDRIMMGNNVYIDNVHNISVINNTNNYNRRVYNAGPRREEIENANRAPVQVIRVSDNSAPVKSEISNGAVNIYRPRFNNENNNAAKPARVVPIENVKQRSSTPGSQQQGTPRMNKENNSYERSPVRQPQFQQPENKSPNNQRETQQPSVTPQQQQPQRENNQAPSGTRNNQVTTPAQPQQAPRQENNQAPARVNGGQAVKPVQQQPQQQNKGAVKRTSKPVKPVKNTPDKKADSKEKASPEGK